MRTFAQVENETRLENWAKEQRNVQLIMLTAAGCLAIQVALKRCLIIQEVFGLGDYDRVSQIIPFVT